MSPMRALFRPVAWKAVSERPVLVTPRSRRSALRPVSRHLHGTASLRYRINPGDAQAYEAASEEAMDSLTDSLSEMIEEDAAPLSGCDCDYSSGVLTLDAGDAGTYVINKQPPNKQIWLSSPRSGPKRYDYDQEAGEWFYARDGSRLQDLLNEELGAIATGPINVRVRHQA